MKITKTSILTGKVHTMDLDITEEQLARFKRGEDLIQNIFPHLTPSEREFLLSGATDEEWNAAFGVDGDE